MTENEAKAMRWIKNIRDDAVETLDLLYPGRKEKTETIIDVFEELERYRAIGTIEFLTDMKSNYVEVLSDLRQYQKIGTVEECREAREMTRKYCKPKYLGENIGIGCREGMCECGTVVRSYEKFCSDCGFELDWSEVGE